MTLIIEIALGIVLGGLLLTNLDAVLGLGMVVFALVAGLVVLGVAGYLLVGYWAEVTLVGCLIGAFAVPFVIIEKINPARGRHLKKRIKDREFLGYEATQERRELDELIKKRKPLLKPAMASKLPPGGTPQKERERRRLLGYDE